MSRLNADERDYGRYLRLATLGALAYSIVPSFNDIVYIFVAWTGDSRRGAWATAATALFLPLHVRHVWYGAQAKRPPAGVWTLAAMTAVILAALPFAGGHWVRSFSALAASAMIVLRPPWGGLAFAGVVAAGLPLALTLGELRAESLWDALMVLWRGLILFVLVWLAAALHRLQAARRAVADDAVARERHRIDTELQRSLGAALESIVRRGQRAAEQVGRDDPALAGELRTLVDGSRRTLARARRLIRGYQQVSLWAELETAATLLTTAGIETTVTHPRRRLPDGLEQDVRAELRATITRLLRDGLARSCVITVTRDGRVQLETDRPEVLAS